MDKDKLLNQRYEIKEILGRGGFATTYLAVDTETQQKCAIKCLSFRKIEEWKTLDMVHVQMPLNVVPPMVVVGYI